MNEININLRQRQLQDLNKYINDTDKDITLILQSLQWDRKHLQKCKQIVTCQYDSNHQILADNVKEHEEKCYLKSQNYVTGDLLFPETLDVHAVTVVKLSSENINDIINYAVQTNPSFKRKGSESSVSGHAPLTLGRLQATYSTDERRALYDAVVAAAPPPVALDQPFRDPTNVEPSATSTGAESRNDALLALRDARRRRARHRRAARDGYKHELRELITTQMEFFTGKYADDNADIKLEVTNDDIDDGRRYEEERDLRNHGRDDCRTKYINPNTRESKEDKRREYKRESRDNKARGYERESREDKRGKKERDSRGYKETEYERDKKDHKRREYEREGREEKRRKYDSEYDRKSKQSNKIHERSDRKHQQQYDREYLEIKQEKDNYPADRRKRDERRYDYKDRERDGKRTSPRDNIKYHRREDRYHKQVG